MVIEEAIKSEAVIPKGWYLTYCGAWDNIFTGKREASYWTLNRYVKHKLDTSFPFASREAVCQAIQTGTVKWGRFEKMEVAG